MQQLTPRVWAETAFDGCNVGLIATGEGVLMVECPQCPSAASQWNQFALTKGTPRYLVHLEHHGDHTTSTYMFPEAATIAHRLVRQDMAKNQIDNLLGRVRELDPGAQPLLAGYRYRLPEISFDGELDLHLGSVQVKLLHLPGHTRGQTAVYLPQERVVFVGENVFHKVQTAFYDVLPFEWLESLRRIVALDVDVIVPGHGEVCDKSYLAEQVAFIQEWLDAVRQAIRKGWTLEETRQRISFLDRYPTATRGTPARAQEMHRRNVDRLYEVLTATP